MPALYPVLLEGKTFLLDSLVYLVPASALCGVVWCCIRFAPQFAASLSYLLFFITPVLTYCGVLAPLTGFDGGHGTGWLFGITFLTPCLAILLRCEKAAILLRPKAFLANCLNPVYLLSGPIPNSVRFSKPRWRNLKRRFVVMHRHALVGAFFLLVAAPAFTEWLLLKNSTNPLDTLVFGFFFELYVYFNFAGYSLLALSVLRMVGLPAPMNFKQPFSAGSVVEYWQRWHTSLGYVLRQLFFDPIKRRSNVGLAVWATFLASAIWHGVTPNFMAWGVFQAGAWYLSRWLYMQGSSMWLQALLLVFAIVLGRVLFSESETAVLLTKLHNLVFWPQGLSSRLPEVIAGLGKLDLIRLVLALTIILCEIFQRRSRARLQPYRHLRQPLASCCLLVLILLFAGGNDNGAVYGAR